MSGQDLRRPQDSVSASSAPTDNMGSTYDIPLDDDEDASRPQTPANASLNRRYTDFLHIPRQRYMREQKNLRSFVNEETGVHCKLPFRPLCKHDPSPCCILCINSLT